MRIELLAKIVNRLPYGYYLKIELTQLHIASKRLN